MVEYLRASGWDLVTLADVWGDQQAQRTEDVTWIRQAGNNDLVVLTKDERIRYRHSEQAALIEAAVRVFCFPNANLPTRDQIERVEESWKP